VLAAAISFPVGFGSGLRRGGVLDQSARVFFTLSFAMPAFWLGIILIILFSVHLHVFPLNGFGSGFIGHLYNLFLPALTIALGFSTVLVRSLRSATIAALQAEFVDTAQMKGIPWSQVLWRHVFRNAVLAVVAVYGVNLAYLISGTVLVENVFSLPGLGSLLVSSVADRDYPVVQGVTTAVRGADRGHQPAHRHRAGRAGPASGTGDRRVSTMWAASPSELLMRAATRTAGRRRSVTPAAADSHRRPGHAGPRDRRRDAGAGAGQPVPPTAIDPLHPLAPPGTAGHLLGSDQYGRDLLARILYGGRIDLAIAFGATAVTLVGGTIIGLVAGYVGGKLDTFLMRLVDLFFAFPFLVLIIAIVAMLGPSIFNMFLAIWITSWVAYARIMRAQTVVAKKQQYVLAARALGYSPLRIMFRHILPTTASSVILFSMVERGGEHHPGRVARLPRARRSAADPGMGGDDRRRPELHPDVLVAGHHPRAGRGVRRRGVQPDRRRAGRPAAGR